MVATPKHFFLQHRLFFGDRRPVAIPVATVGDMKVIVENETRLKIKKLGIDNSDEYEAKRFKKYCYKHEIIIERIVLGMLQHSGVVSDRDDTYTKNLEKNGLVYVKVNDVLNTPIIDPPQLEESVENNNDQHLNTFEPSTPTLIVRKSP
ncbi:hypothetical protein V8G54_019958 [Vigna mungo]|uniref:Uncharacterized protein n=1 Tax=Vigna mungo TaxID=3915 RepID=A0AAQ3NBD2_VIGMU